MAKKPTGPQVLTGNRLSDGRVVFLTPEGGWDLAIDAARFARTPEEAAELERIGAEATAANVILDTYLVEVTEDSGQPVPVRLRERFRIAGPTVGHSRGDNGQAGRASADV